MAPFDLSLGLEDTHVLITGGCGLIGTVVVKAFLAAGSHVSVLDIVQPKAGQFAEEATAGKIQFFEADISQPHSIDAAFSAAEAKFGPVECCLALASLDLSSLAQTDSLCDAEPERWREVFDVNIHGTFLTSQRWLRGLRGVVLSGDQERIRGLKNVGLILMGSESGKFGVRGCAAYAAGKAAVQYGLLPSLAKDVSRVYLKGRVNAVAPAAVDTERFQEECVRYGKQWEWGEFEGTVPMGKAVPTEDVARTFVFLASERWSGSTHGQVLHVDGGKMGSVVWREGELEWRGREERE